MDCDGRLRWSDHRLHSQGTRYSAFGAMFSIIVAREDDGTNVFPTDSRGERQPVPSIKKAFGRSRCQETEDRQNSFVRVMEMVVFLRY